MKSNSKNTILSQMLKEREGLYRDEYEVLIPAHIQLVEKCKTAEELSQIVSCRHIDLKVRLAAAEKITDEIYLNYLLMALTIVLDSDNVEVVLYLAQKVKDKKVINYAMQDILTDYTTFEITEYFDKVLANVTDISVLEEFISREEARNPNSKWLKFAFDRAMQLLDN